MAYSINVPTAGTYTFKFRIATGFPGAELQVRNANGSTVLGTAVIPGTGGWQSWVTVTTSVTLPAGQQTIRIYDSYSNFNFNWFEVIAPAGSNSNTQTGAAGTIVSTIQAEDYTAMHGIQTETTSDAGGGLNVGWIDPNDWMQYNINVPTAGSYTFNFRVASGFNGAELQVRNANGSTVLGTATVPGTGGWQTWATTSATITLPAGQQTIRIYDSYSNFNFNWFQIVTGSGSTPTPAPTPTPTPAPTPTTPAAGNLSIPGLIQAEDYTAMSGVQTETTTDAGGGLNVGYIDPNDYMEYAVNVAAAGTYTFKFRVACGFSGSELQVRNASGVNLGTATVPGTGGWQTWATVTTTVTLPAGQQTLRIYDTYSNFNFNWFEATSSTVIAPPTPPSPSTPAATAFAIPGMVQAESYTAMSGVQTETTTDAGGGLNVGWLDPNDWMEYPVNVATAGNYTFKFRVACGFGGATLQVRNAAGIVLGAVNVPATGGWQNWATVSTTIALPAGVQNIRIYDTYSNFNFNWFEATSSTIIAPPTQPGGGNNNSGSAAVIIPMQAKYFYELNNYGDGRMPTYGLQQMIDGVTGVLPTMGYGKLFSNYKCYYQFANLNNVMISKIRFFDGQHSFPTSPFKLYAKSSVSATPVLLATFTGEQNYQWVEINLPAPVPAQYLMMDVYWGLPDEMELYGSYTTAPAPTLAALPSIKFADECAINSFVWNFEQNFVDPNLRDSVYAANWKLMNTFSGYRDYVDWEKIEPVQGQYYFDHTIYGGWNYDMLYKKMKENNKLALLCFKTVPSWFLDANYPADKRDAENVPAPYTSDWSQPASYIAQAKVAFQLAARYGSTAVDTTLLPGVVTGPVYPTASNTPWRVKKTGLDYIKYMECENERDKWWKGRQAYQTGREYAANLSAFYDGHKGTLGNNVGAKTADPNMKIVIGGIASTQPDYFRAIIDWCKEFRGYKQDGSVDLCFDVINYHAYANDAQVSQAGNASRGAAPEVAGVAACADKIVELAREYGVEAWITETGYDYNGSSQGVVAIGSKSKTAVQADWMLRTALLNARHGIARTFLYTTYDEHPESWALFGTSGMLEEATRTRKASADYIHQASKLIGSYTFQSADSTSTAGVIKDKYAMGPKNAWVVIKASENGSTASTTVNVGSATAYVYTPVMGADSMSLQIVNTSNGILSITAEETPKFVLSTQMPQGKIVKNEDLAAEALGTLLLYPNPATDRVTVTMNGGLVGPVAINLLDITGATVRTQTTEKSGSGFSSVVNLNGLANGTYMLEVTLGGSTTTQKVVKVN